MSRLHALRCYAQRREKVVQDELELQYLENSTVPAGNCWRKLLLRLLQPAPKKPHILDGLYSDDEDDDTEPEADNPVAAPLSKKEAIVKEALDYWLVDREPSKPQANGQTALSMVAFWSKEDASAPCLSRIQPRRDLFPPPSDGVHVTGFWGC